MSTDPLHRDTNQRERSDGRPTSPVSGDAELDLNDYLTIIRERWAWVLTPLIIVPSLALWWTLQQADVYAAEARVLLADTAAQKAIDGTETNVGARGRDLANEINVAKSDEARAAVEDRLGIDNAHDLVGTITADPTSDVIDFRFEAATPDNAATIANTWADVYVDLKRTEAADSIDQTVAQLEAALEGLKDRRRDIRADLEALEDRLVRATEDDQRRIQLLIDRERSEISDELDLVDAQIEASIQSITQVRLSGQLATVGTARVFRLAVPSQTPTNAPPARNLALGVVVGGILGVALALTREQLDQTITSPDDVAALGLPSLGTIPVADKQLRKGELALVGLQHPDSPVADAYQKVRTALQFASLGNEIRSVVVTSPNQSEGKTTTSVNLASAFSSVGKRVALVDTDLRRPRIHQIFDRNPTPGLTDALMGNLRLADVVIHADGGRLVAIPAGTQPPTPATFFSSKLFTKLAKQLDHEADLIVFDAPPVLPVADALSVAQIADGVIVVVRAGSSKRQDLRQTVETIAHTGGSLLGVVIVGAKNDGRYGAYYGEDTKRPKGEGGSTSSHAIGHEDQPTADDDVITLPEATPEPAGRTTDVVSSSA